MKEVHRTIFDTVKTDSSSMKKQSDNPGSHILQSHSLTQIYEIIYMNNNSHTDTVQIFEFTPSDNSYYELSLNDHAQKEKTNKHKHNFYEIMFILDGVLFQEMDGKNYTFKQSDCYIINRNTQHFEYLTTDFQALFFDLSDELLTDLILHDVSYHSDGTRYHHPNEIYSFFNFNQSTEKKSDSHLLLFQPTKLPADSLNFLLPHINQIIIDAGELKPGFLFEIEAAFCKIFAILSNSEYYKSNHQYSASSLQYQTYIRILQEFEYSKGKVSWKEFEQRMHYSAEYLNKIMKQFSGLTLNQYSVEYRLRLAAESLRSSNSNIENIIQDLEFTNRSYFYRVFEKNTVVLLKNIGMK